MKELEKYGYTWEQAEKWARERGYGDLLSCRTLIAHLFLKAMGKPIEVPRRLAGPVKSIADFTVGEVGNIRVVVVDKVDERKYEGCPTCYRKLNGTPGETVDCERCGPVTVTTLSWKVYLVGDQSGEVIIQVPPRILLDPKPGERWIVNGTLTERQDFQVYAMVREMEPKVREETPRQEAPKQEAPQAPQAPKVEAPQEQPKPEAKPAAPAPGKPADTPEVRFLRLAQLAGRDVSFVQQKFRERFPGRDWERALEEAGLRVENNRLVPSS